LSSAKQNIQVMNKESKNDQSEHYLIYTLL